MTRYTHYGMSERFKYLVTTDAETGEVIRVEQLGSAGDLTEVQVENLGGLKLVPIAGDAVREPDAEHAEEAPGVFVSGELPGAEEEAPGVFFSGELSGAEEEAPGVFISGELPGAEEEAPGVFLSGELPGAEEEALGSL